VRRGILVLIVAPLVIYAGVSVSPLPDLIARRDPALASYFSPPGFNFSATYISGSVLGFRVDAERAEFISALKSRYSRTAVLLASCGTGALFNTAESFIPVADSPRAQALLERDLICVDLQQSNLFLTITMSRDKVKTIKLACIHSEGA
jgi:hypothetical protein